MSRFLDVLSVSPLPDGKQWRVNGDFRYESALAGLITVPDRLVTDFASIPRIIQNIYPVWDLYGPAALVHDALYWANDDRGEADLVLREAMILLAVPADTVAKIYAAVDYFGQAAWERNAQLSASGYTRLAGTGSQPPYAQLPDLPLQ